MLNLRYLLILSIEQAHFNSDAAAGLRLFAQLHGHHGAAPPLFKQLSEN